MPIVQSIDDAKAEKLKAKRGGPSPQAYVRFQRRKTSHGHEAIELQLGRAVWYGVGRPERVALEVVGGGIGPLGPPARSNGDGGEQADEQRRRVA